VSDSPFVLIKREEDTKDTEDTEEETPYLSIKDICRVSIYYSYLNWRRLALYV